MCPQPQSAPIPRSTVAVLVLVTLISVGASLAPREVGLRFAAEDGPVEMAANAVLGVAVIIALLRMVRGFSLAWLSGTVLLLWAFLRELDFQKHFTYRSIESIGYYVSPRAPWPEKLLVILIMIPFCLAGMHVLWLLLKTFRPGITRREPWTLHLVAAIGLGVIGSICEKLLSLAIVEEACELGLELLVLLIVLELRKKSPNISTPTPEFPTSSPPTSGGL